jgi:hypothetical protein
VVEKAEVTGLGQKAGAPFLGDLVALDGDPDAGQVRLHLPFHPEVARDARDCGHGIGRHLLVDEPERP